MRCRRPAFPEDLLSICLDEDVTAPRPSVSCTRGASKSPVGPKVITRDHQRPPGCVRTTSRARAGALIGTRSRDRSRLEARVELEPPRVGADRIVRMMFGAGHRRTSAMQRADAGRRPLCGFVQVGDNLRSCHHPMSNRLVPVPGSRRARTTAHREAAASLDTLPPHRP